MFVDNACQEKRSKIKQNISEEKLDKIHEGIEGPTAGGEWYEMEALCRHFDHDFQKKQNWRERMILKKQEIVEDQMDLFLDHKEQQMELTQEMQYFAPNDEVTFIDRMASKKKM